MGHILTNGILSVEIGEIGAYSGPRFDWTGFITQVTLEQGKHTFCVPESLIPGAGSGGSGLCNEFGISRAMGYDETEAGDWFPKPGIGLLQKPDDAPYTFMGNYKIKPFGTEIQTQPHSVTYTVQPMECNGYSMRITKSLQLSGNKLIIDYTLDNVGSKIIETEEYIHNFIGINRHPVGKDYELRLPGEISLVEPESSFTTRILQVKGNKLSWRRYPKRPFYCKLMSAAADRADDFNWELIHRPSGVGLRESGDFPVARMTLWGIGHVISPEVFVNISLLPRQSKHWRRCYEFFQLD